MIGKTKILKNPRFFKYLTKNSIRRRLFIYFTLLILPAIVLLGSVSYLIATNVLEENITQSSGQVVNQVLLHLELYLRQYQQYSLSALGNQFAQKFLTVNSNDLEALRSYSVQVDRFLFNPIFTGRYEIEGIYLAGHDGRVAAFNKRENRLGLYFQPGIMEKLPWVNQVPADGSMLVSGVYFKNYGSEFPVISLARRISDPVNPSQMLGVFWVELNLQRIQEICQPVRLGKSGYLAIIDASGKVIYHPGIDNLGKLLPYAFVDRILKSAYGYFYHDIAAYNYFYSDVDGVNSLIIHSISRDTKWHLVAIVPFAEIAGGIVRLKNITILMVLFWGAATLVLSITFAAGITKPIERLQQTMEEAARGYLDGVVPVESTDEVGKLTQNFNRMLKKIQTLIVDNYISKIRQANAESKQRHAELRALQAQINPHFLYNTLGTISSLAMMEGVDSISRMAEALSEFFRYSIHNDEIMVTLRDELAQVERYFIIQRIRYGERISLETDIDQSLLNQPLVKLTLQPIVENACIHGLESTGQGKIRIHSEARADKWRIFITDTGIGISETDLIKIKGALENPEAAEEAGSQFGIGLRNVQARLKLHYGSEYGLEIDSKEGEGTTVILNIPFATEISSS
ncbi:MAG: cache domain-containing sensor histidine kinase [Bacteroidota bacterium]